MTVSGTDRSALPRLEVHVVVGPGWGGEFGQWARSLDASVRSARRRALVGAVVAVAVDLTVVGKVEAPAPAIGGVDTWSVRRSRPGVDDPTVDAILLADASVELSPSTLGELLVALADPGTGIVEPRHIPFQSRKPVDLATAEVSWASTSCCLVRPAVLTATGGLDLEGFEDAGPGAEVDLSWKARLAGWSVRCAPAAAVVDKRPVPMGDPLLHPSRPASSAKLALAARYLGPGAAHAWVRAWRARGTSGERAAAIAYETAPSTGPTAVVAGDTDTFAQELFGIHRTTSSPPDRYDLTPGDIGRRSRERRAADPAAPFLSVVVRTQGSRLADLEDNLLSLCAQDCADFEVLVMCHDLDDARRRAVEALVRSFRGEFSGRVRTIDVSGGGRARPLNVALGEASGRYLAFLDDDDVALGTWVSSFRTVARDHPGAVVWSQVAWQTSDVVQCAGRRFRRIAESPKLFVREFDVVSHLIQNGTPNCAIAVPRSIVAEHDLRFREDLTVFEDWDMVLRLAQLAPFVSTGVVTALYRRGSVDGSGEVHGPSEWDSSASQVLDDLDRSGFHLRGEHLPGLRAAIDELAELRRQLGDDEAPAGTLAAVRAGTHQAAEARLVGDGWAEGRRIVIVGTHLDDAVLSCGSALTDLRDVTVLTVFAGGAHDWSRVTAWDEACGFESGTDVLAARVREDEAALSVLGAVGDRLEFADEQYRSLPDPTVEEIGEAILARIGIVGAGTVFVPLGLGHGDHRLTGAACAWAARRRPDLDWIAYQDLPYAYEGDGIDEAVSAYDDMRPEPIRFPRPIDTARKSDAVACYTSQVVGLGTERMALALEAERYWQLGPVAPEPGR